MPTQPRPTPATENPARLPAWVDAGQWVPAGAPAATLVAADATAWLTVPLDGAHEPAASSGPVFVSLDCAAVASWLARQIKALATLPPAPIGDTPEDTSGTTFVRCYPRLELPTSPATRDFLKAFPHDLFAAWLTALEARAVAPVVMFRAGDYTKTALDLRQVCSRHRDERRAPGSVHRFAVVLDDFAADDAEQWQAGMRLGDHQPVYLLARGLPGCARHEHGRLPDELPAATRDRAEEMYHHAVGELGTERILFGSGLNTHDHDPDRARRQAALADWFRAPRAWLDEASVDLIFGANQRRLLMTKAECSGQLPATSLQPEKDSDRMASF